MSRPRWFDRFALAFGCSMFCSGVLLVAGIYERTAWEDRLFTSIGLFIILVVFYERDRK